MIGMNKLSSIKRKLRKFSAHLSHYAKTLLHNNQKKKKVNIEALGHLYAYFGEKEWIHGTSLCSLGINVPSLNNLGNNSSRLSTAPFEVVPKYVIMNVWGCICFSKLTN